jgi:hypothetical protein
MLAPSCVGVRAIVSTLVKHAIAYKLSIYAVAHRAGGAIRRKAKRIPNVNVTRVAISIRLAFYSETDFRGKAAAGDHISMMDCETRPQFQIGAG